MLPFEVRHAKVVNKVLESLRHEQAALAEARLKETAFFRREIKENAVYSPREAAKKLGVTSDILLDRTKTRKLPRAVGQPYTGSQLLRLLDEEEALLEKIRAGGSKLKPIHAHLRSLGVSLPYSTMQRQSRSLYADAVADLRREHVLSPGSVKKIIDYYVLNRKTGLRAKPAAERLGIDSIKSIGNWRRNGFPSLKDELTSEFFLDQAAVSSVAAKRVDSPSEEFTPLHQAVRKYGRRAWEALFSGNVRYAVRSRVTFLHKEDLLQQLAPQKTPLEIFQQLLEEKGIKVIGPPKRYASRHPFWPGIPGAHVQLPTSKPIGEHRKYANAIDDLDKGFQFAPGGRGISISVSYYGNDPEKQKEIDAIFKHYNKKNAVRAQE